MIRQPIISVLGHVDSGKTTLLDCIRGTVVAKTEPGAITQAIGATNIPASTIKKICGPLLKKLKITLTIPGLLTIDTPGHESFTTLRMRGGSIADLAILVIDIQEGIMPQTDESLGFLRDFKTPFVVAVTKIDLIKGWTPKLGASFSETFKNQSDFVKEMLEEKIYSIIAQLAERGYDAERFDRVTDFKKQIAVVPCSGKTGEGITELLMVLAGLAQQFLVKKLLLSELGRGAVLEVKETRGFGPTIDVILYDGKAKQGDYLIIGGKKPLVTRIKALLVPPVLRELRVEKRFKHVREVSAAAGIKIAAPGLAGVIAGSPLICTDDAQKIDEAKNFVQEEVEMVEFAREIDGVIAKADSLGSLEALVKSLQGMQISIRRAEIGEVSKADLLEAKGMPDKFKIIFAFNVGVLPGISKLAADYKIKILQDQVIYSLLERYTEWEKGRAEREKLMKLASLTRPAKLKLLQGYVFRKSKPAIVGVEVLAGTIRPGCSLVKTGRIVGKLKQIQREGVNLEQAKIGEHVAISIEGPTVGRQIIEGDILYVALGREAILELEKSKNLLRPDELELLHEIKEMKIEKGKSA
jgi:translation initiation factor 5B